MNTRGEHQASAVATVDPQPSRATTRTSAAHPAQPVQPTSTAPTAPVASARPYALAAALAGGSAAVAVLMALVLDLPLRDPDGFAGPAWVRLPAIVLLFVVADVVPRVVRRAGAVGGASPALRAVLRERCSWQRLSLVLLGLVSFYVTYVAYRNMKSFLPFAREGTADQALLQLDRDMALGYDPGTLLHELLGTGIAAHGLSAAYLLFLAFVPVSLAAALVWTRDVARGAWYVTALCINWLLGVVSYYALPSLGPVFARPTIYAVLPETGVSRLQETLVEHRFEVLADPHATSAVHGIAGFASLHVSIVFTAALIATLMGLRAVVRWSAWAFFVLTVLATVYFGWHYLVDDLAGLVMGAVAVAVAGYATGQFGRSDEDAPQHTRPAQPAESSV